jgi:hypothetical protein
MDEKYCGIVIQKLLAHRADLIKIGLQRSVLNGINPLPLDGGRVRHGFQVSSLPERETDARSSTIRDKVSQAGQSRSMVEV